MKLEVCIDRLESALAAKTGGADRLEVCGALKLGGITPSYGLVEECLGLGGIEVVVMIRPHEGGFCYESADIQTMIRDIQVAKQLGTQGVVFGALQRDGRIDRDLCRRLRDEALPLSVTFHRAFDLTPDPREAIDCLVELGVDRLLTSGQAVTAVRGAELIRELVNRAGDAIYVMPGGGIQPADVITLVRTTGVREIHSSASQPEDSPGGDNALGIVQRTRLTNEATVRALVAALRKADPT